MTATGITGTVTVEDCWRVIVDNTPTSVDLVDVIREFTVIADCDPWEYAPSSGTITLASRFVMLDGNYLTLTVPDGSVLFDGAAMVLSDEFVTLGAA